MSTHLPKNIHRRLEQPAHGFKVGDIVVSSNPHYPLRCGSMLYFNAVVVSVYPLVLVSRDATMRWESPVEPERLKVIGEASPMLLALCLGRL
jgi:hypothetical protein